MNDPDLSHHYKVLKQFLDISDDSTSRSKSNSSRAARAREKLLKLSGAQFKELSTDVYDELRRRIDESRSEPDFLLPKSSFHPKRNQARQKLSSLPQSRFKDLVSDISYEIERRFLHVPKAAESASPTQSSVSDTHHRSGSETSQSQHQRKSQSSDNFQSSSTPSQASPVAATHALDNVETNQSEKSLATINPSHSTTLQDEIATPDFRETTPQQAIGIQASKVVPAKASMAWSSDEEDEKADEEDEQPRRLSLTDAFPPRGTSISSKGLSSNNYDELKAAYDSLLKDYEDLNLQFTSLQTQETDTAAMKRMYEVATAKNTELEQTLNELMKDKERYLSSVADLPTPEEIESLRSANAALRLENQSFRSPQSNGNGHIESRALSSNTQPIDVNAELRNFYDRLDQLSSMSISKSPTNKEQLLKTEISQWQKKYENLKASKLASNSKDLPSSSVAKSYKSPGGLIPLEKVTEFFALIDSFFEAIQSNNPSEDLLFEKICTTAIAADKISQEGSKATLGNSGQSDQIKEAATHALTATRYFVTHSQMLPKSIVERAVSELAFSVCDFISIFKINDGTKPLDTPQPVANGADDEMNVRPLKIARSANEPKVQQQPTKTFVVEPSSPVRSQSKKYTQTPQSGDLGSGEKSPSILDKVKKFETDQAPGKQAESITSTETNKSAPETAPTRNKSIFQSLRDRFTADNGSDKNASSAPAAETNEDTVDTKEPEVEKKNDNGPTVFRDISNASDTIGSQKSSTTTEPKLVNGAGSDKTPAERKQSNASSEFADVKSTNGERKKSNASSDLSEVKSNGPSSGSNSLKSTLSSKMSKALSGGLRKTSVGSDQQPQSAEPVVGKDVVSKGPSIETGKGLRVKSPSFKVRKVTPKEQAAANAREEESSEEDEDEQDELRQRQDYRKSMAAATFNFDLFDIDDPDNTVTQVLLYLEHQTVQVIATIQDLLSAIKKPDATKGDLRENSNAISEVIKQMTEATNTSMNQTRNFQLKEHGSWVVKSLEDCNHRMDALCRPSTDTPDDQEFADRSFKQRLAGISFDIAKCTKELVKTVEEASLKEDIAHLDARLNHNEDLT